MKGLGARTQKLLSDNLVLSLEIDTRTLENIDNVLKESNPNIIMF